MDAMTRIEQALVAAVAHADGPGCPPRLSSAVRHAVFPQGSRLRPQLCLAVAQACGEDYPRVTDAAAAAIELLHCASLVHDDLPCFDDAPIRRGKPSVHAAFGEPLAVLTGDALIVLAFETLARGVKNASDRLPTLLLTIGHSVGMPCGIVAGQAWEGEPDAVLADYQRAKTGALFAGATMAGAAATGVAPDEWRLLGERLGEAYQVVDDIRDVAADPDELGKPTGRDEVLGRPNAARQLGMRGALERLDGLIAEAVASIPACSGRAELRTLVRLQAQRFLPKEMGQIAA
jgi:geranylgeranyl diphosphate synthase type II